MPNYDYECRKCSRVFEVFQRITEDPLSRCPKCGGPVKRLIGGGVGVIFKGSGFYTTDYKRSAASTEGSSSGNGDGKKTESVASGKSDSGKTDSGKSESGKHGSGKPAKGSSGN